MVDSIANPQEQDVEVEVRKRMGTLTKWFRVMGEAGLTTADLQADIDSAERRARHLTYIKTGCFQPTTGQRLAREIMGDGYLGIEESVQHLGAKPRRAQQAVLAEIPFTEAVLRECRESHVLVATFPFSILEIRGKVNRQLFYRHEDAWFNNETFAKTRCGVGWHLICKTPVANSTSKTWDEGQVLLAQNEETPLARVMVYTIIGYFLATGKRLFPDVWVRCSDLDSYGCRVSVGDFDRHGLLVHSVSDDRRFDYLGLASARKLPEA